jgi:hypothetical protein
MSHQASARDGSTERRQLDGVRRASYGSPGKSQTERATDPSQQKLGEDTRLTLFRGGALSPT